MIRRAFIILVTFLVFSQDLNLEILNELTVKLDEVKLSSVSNYNTELENASNLAYSIIVGVRYESIQQVIEGKFEELEQNVKLSDIIAPILFEISRSLSRPRDLLREEFKLSVINGYINRLERSKLAVLDTLNSEISSSLKDLLKISLEKIDAHLSSLKTAKALSEARIADLNSIPRGGLLAAWSTSLFNIAQAFLISAIFFVLLKQIKIFVEKLPLPVNPSVSMIRRVILITLVIVNFLGSILVFTFTLYLKGELFLLGISILIIVAVGVLSKRLITDFFSQAAILLNLGFVREGELIIFKDLPFRLRSLGFICFLDNPMLRHSVVRVPLSDLVDQRSFQPDSDLDWFPTKEGDFIFLEGDTLPSQILEQSINFIKICRPDKSLMEIPPKNFLNAKFRKISETFVVFLRLGIAYKHLPNISDLSDKLKKTLESFCPAELEKASVPNFNEITFNASFLDFAQSSLDFGLSATCKQLHAPFYGLIRRSLVNAFLMFVLENNLEIPFNSITVYRGN